MTRERPETCTCACRPSQPALVLFKGQPGSGKSTLGRALAATLLWPLIDKDDARSPFQHLAAANPDIDWNTLSYNVMFRYVETQLACGVSVIVDCPLARQALYDRAVALAAQYGAQVAVVELEPGDAELWRQRVEQRGQRDRGTEHEHKPGNWADVQAGLARNGGSKDWSAAADIPLHCRLDSTAGSTPQHLQEVLYMLQSGGMLPASPAAPAV